MNDKDISQGEIAVKPGMGERTAVSNWMATASKEEIVDAIIFAGRDPLTGLLNRRGLNDEVGRTIDVLEAYKAELSKISEEEDVKDLLENSRLIGFKSIQVIALDLSGFKKYNDLFGGGEGDKVLKKLAVGLHKVFTRTTDVHGRWGGDEFVVVSINSPITKEDLEQMQKQLDAFLPESVKTYIAYLNNEPGTVDQKITDAMEFLTLAKKTGKVDETGRSIGGGLVYKDVTENV